MDRSVFSTIAEIVGNSIIILIKISFNGTLSATQTINFKIKQSNTMQSKRYISWILTCWKMALGKYCFFLIIKQFSFCRIRNLLCTVKTLQFIISICLEYALSGFYWHYVVSCHRHCEALMSANVTWVSSDSLYITHHYRKKIKIMCFRDSIIL